MGGFSSEVTNQSPLSISDVGGFGLFTSMFGYAFGHDGTVCSLGLPAGVRGEGRPEEETGHVV